MKRVVIAALVALSLSGCAGLSGGRGGAFCDVEEPVRLSKETIATLSKEELERDVAHNRYGAKECGWRRQ